ncbi:MAG: helix-turn-helix domain-containing protein [Patescibacteria group bacterium]
MSESFDTIENTCYLTPMDALLLQKLTQLGLQKNEAKIYLTTLELGQGTVTTISKAAYMNRTTGYDILERLCVFGIVNRSLLKKKRIYISEPPIRLKYYLENKKRQAERRMEELETMLPDLKSLHNNTNLKPIIKFAEGKKAMEQMYYHKLDSKSTIYSILNQKNVNLFDEMGSFQSLERFKRGIKEKVLAIENDEGVEWYKKIYGKNKKRQANTEYRWIKNEQRGQTGGEISIFDDKVNVLLSSSTENMAFEIQSQTFADFLKVTFELAWTKAQNKF